MHSTTWTVLAALAVVLGLLALLIPLIYKGIKRAPSKLIVAGLIGSIVLVLVAFAMSLVWLFLLAYVGLAAFYITHFWRMAAPAAVKAADSIDRHAARKDPRAAAEMDAFDADADRAESDERGDALENVLHEAIVERGDEDVIAEAQADDD